MPSRPSRLAAPSTRPSPRPNPRTKATPGKTFIAEPWGDDKVGQKILLYGKNGRGKSSLAVMAPDPVFIGIDTGAQNIRHPETGDRPRHIPGIETFGDLREAVRQAAAMDMRTLVIDTITKVETTLAIPWVFKTVPGPQGARAADIEAYGYGKGYRYLFDVMGMLWPEFEAVAATGKNVLLLAQQENHRVANASGDDYVCAGPNLNSRNPSTMRLYCEQVDHIFRLDYASMAVKKDTPLSNRGKAVGSTTRAVFTDAEVHFEAKTRTLPNGDKLPPVVSFENEADSSLWDLMFPR